MCAYVTIPPIPPPPITTLARPPILSASHASAMPCCAHGPRSALAFARRHSGRACPSEARSAPRTVSLVWAAAKPLALALARFRAAPNAQWDSVFYKWCVDHRIQDMMYAAPAPMRHAKCGGQHARATQSRRAARAHAFAPLARVSKIEPTPPGARAIIGATSSPTSRSNSSTKRASAGRRCTLWSARPGACSVARCMPCPAACTL
jgi:hypothetical protein